MKKILLSLVLILGLNTSAQAGIGVFFGAASVVISLGEEEPYGLILTAPLAIICLLKAGELALFGNPTLALIVLDSKPTNVHQLQTILSEKFNFIDNQSVLADLSQKLHAPLEAARLSGKTVANIALPADLVRNSLEAADLSEGEIQQVIEELK